MKIKLSASLFLIISLLPASGAVLFADNFNATDSASFDSSDLTGRRSGTVATDTYLRSWGEQQALNTNQLLFPVGNSGVRFELSTNDPTVGANDRYDWAAGAGSAAILAAGGFVVSFDWYPSNNTDLNWLSFQVGTSNADRVNLASTDVDYGILFRNIGLTERFDNGANLGPGGSFTATGVGLVRQVEITYLFSSFADGSTVNSVSKVNGVQVANDTFTWDTNAGQLRMEIGSDSPGNRMDNLVIATVPEPSGTLLAGLGILGLLRRRR